MPIVLPQAERRPTFSSQLGSAIGGGLGQGLNNAADFTQQLMKAKYQNDLQRGLLFQGANARLNLRNSGTGESPTSEITISPGDQLRGNLPTTAPIENNQTNEPSPPKGNLVKTNPPEGNVDYRKQKIRTPTEIQNEANRRANYLRSQGIPTNPLEEEQFIRQEEQDKLNYKATQEQYGNLAEKALTNVLPSATDEQKSIFARKAEEYIDSNISESELKKNLALDAKNFTNRLSRVEKSLPPRNRLGTKIKDALLGTGRESEKVRNSIRLDVQSLLDEGLYDTSRQLLSNAGYYPEEIEGIISELGEGSKKALAELPKMNKISVPLGVFQKKYQNPEEKYSPEQLGDISSSMEKAFKEEPSVNLLLLRKSFEDKGVDWRAFKDVFDNLAQEGKIKLANEDQASFLNNLDEPPLNNLEKILHGIGLRGR